MRCSSPAKTLAAAVFSAAFLLLAAQPLHAALPKPGENPFVKEFKEIEIASNAINAEISAGNNKQKMDVLKAKLKEAFEKKKERLESLQKDFDKEIDKIRERISKSSGAAAAKLEKDKAALESQKLDLEVWYQGKKPEGVPDKPGAAANAATQKK